MTSFNPKILAQVGLLCGAAMLAVGCGGSSSTQASTTNPNDAALAFSTASAQSTTLTVTVDGSPMTVTRYKVCYAAKPIKGAYTQSNLGPPLPLVDLNGTYDPYNAQSMYLFVPAAAANDQKAPIYLRVDNSGWHSQPLAAQGFNNGANPGGTPLVTNGTSYVSTTDTDSIGAALKAGYVVVQAGTRSRGFAAADATDTSATPAADPTSPWAGKAPAPAVDTKAAIRYLRLNDAVMPGSAERIILNGTSGGGGLTSVVSASGNSADYYPFLAEIGAAGITGTGSSAASTLRDDVFAAVAYCPINNFGNVDAGYEWQYNAVRSASNTGTVGGIAYGDTGDGQAAASSAIAGYFAPYLNGLKLTIDDEGTLLTATNMPGVIVGLVKEELERKIAAGTTMPVFGSGTFTANGVALTNDWLSVTGSGYSASVTDLDYTKFVAFTAASRTLKNVVAFDSTGVSTATTPMGQGESDMFGTSSQAYCNFIEWTWSNNDIASDGIGQDDTSETWTQFLATADGLNIAKQLKLISAVDYLTTTGSTAAPHWYIRHGMVDRDTAYAMQVLLYYAAKNNVNVKDVSFKLPYMIGHAGNYDVQEASAWIAKTVNDNPLP